jgi:hypothetical protein
LLPSISICYAPSMRKIRKMIAGTTKVLAAIGCVVLLASCATLVTRDQLGSGVQKGWVIFEDDIGDSPIMIAPISNGMEGPSFRSTDYWIGAPVKIACQPGPNEFVVRHKNYQERIIVQVTEGAITYVGVRAQITASHFTGTGTTTTYFVRSTVGTHPLPPNTDGNDPTPFLVALGDRDWATRSYALNGLDRLKGRVDKDVIPTLDHLAREDPSSTVRAAAGKLLKTLGEPVPAPPLVFVSFEQSAHTWPFGEEASCTTSLEPGGYLVDSRAEHTWSVQTRWFGQEIGSRQNIDIVMECSWMSGAKDMSFGLTLGDDKQAYNAFCANEQGGSVALSVAGGSLSAGPSPLPWTNAASIAIAASPITRLEVSKRGAEYGFRVNGVLVGSFTDTRGLAVSNIGIFTSGVQSVLFHKIIVTAP